MKHALLALALVVVLNGCGDTDSRLAERSPSLSTPSTSAPPPTSSTSAPVDEVPPRAVYYVGPGPDGPDAPGSALYRYVERGAPYDTGTALDPLTATPSDPDYWTLWPRGSFEGVGDPEVGVSVVHLAPGLSLARPDGMSEREAELAIQQVAWTVRDIYAERPEVKLVQGDHTVDSVFGVPTDGGLVRAAPELSVLSHLILTEPAEGAVVSKRFVVHGLANGFEGTAACYVEDPSGSAVWSGATIAGWQEDRLFSFEVEVDLRSLPSGTYVVRCSTDDPTGGTEGRGADVDTRTIVIDQPGNREPLQPTYYVGLTPDGDTGLFRCLEPNDTGEPNHGTGWYLGQLTDDPTDPAYWTWWRRNTFTGILREEDGVTTVEIRDASDVRRRASMTDGDARLALQQLAWTLGADAIRLSVDEAFGIDVSEPIARKGSPPQSC